MRKYPILLKRMVVKIFISEIQVQFLCLNEEIEVHSLCVIVQEFSVIAQEFRAEWAAPAVAISIGKGNGTPENLFLMFIVKDKVMGSFSLALCKSIFLHFILRSSERPVLLCCTAWWREDREPVSEFYNDCLSTLLKPRFPSATTGL